MRIMRNRKATVRLVRTLCYVCHRPIVAPNNARHPVCGACIVKGVNNGK